MEQEQKENWYENAMRTFGKYHPSFGSKMNSFINNRYIKGASPESINGFKKHIGFNEYWHWGALMYNLAFILSDVQGHYPTGLLLQATCSFINVSCILLQRHNRRRINKIEARYRPSSN